MHVERAAVRNGELDGLLAVVDLLADLLNYAQ
jgi:hypothetical protein